MNDQGNLLLAIVLSLLILLGFQYFFEAPKMKKDAERKKYLKETENLLEDNSTNLENGIVGYLELEDALSKNERIKIISCKKIIDHSIPSIIVNNNFHIGCKDGRIVPIIIQREGKKLMEIKDFLRGFQFSIGQKVNA